MEKNAVRAEPSDVTPWRQEDMIEPAARDVLARLEVRDAHERERGVARSERLRQITPEVGRFLNILVLATKPRVILEIGTSGGYSTIWLAMAARETSGHVTTIDVDPVKVTLASQNLREAGLAGIATVIHGDAFAYLRDPQARLDFVFLDAEKEDYLRFYELIVPQMNPGATLVADNLISHEPELAEFRERALSDDRLSAVIVPIGRGELLAVRAPTR
jgi:predicted O-methyltransferase YrrM